ncbi:hypothetical protein ACHAPJ_008458 [Fusarium lateritium]
MPEASLSKPKFQKPHVVVLPQADMADSENGPTIPKLDITPCMKMTIVRQGEESVWNCDDFASQRGIPGKAIMGALVGDKSARNPHGLDLAHTLIRGQDMKLVYIRGNDLGETWFINEQPVFLQFFHCGYLPQFYPASETDHTAMKKESPWLVYEESRRGKDPLRSQHHMVYGQRARHNYITVEIHEAATTVHINLLQLYSHISTSTQRT